MANLNILCMDDQREVLATLKKDMGEFKSYFGLHYCESAAEAQELIEEIDSEGNAIVLIVCDHIMPGKNGIDFLIELNKDIRFKHTKKVLLTGLASHQDTIVAINKAAIHQYIEKPWNSHDLIQVARVLLTEYLVETGQDYQSYLPILDQPTLYRVMRK